MASYDEYGNPVADDTRVPFQASAPEIDTRVPFVSEDATVPVGGDTARYRAMKMHIALGPNSPGIDSLENSIAIGQEGRMRNNISSILTMEKREKMAQNIQKLATSPAPISPEIAQEATRLLQSTPTTEPNVVVEEGFADRYTRRTLELIAKRDRNIAQQALENDKDGALNTIKGNDKLIATRELVRTAIEDMHAKYSAQSWGSWGWNFTKDLIPGVAGAERSPDWDPRNIFFSGTSMEAEIQKLWSFNKLSDRKKWLDARLDSIAKSNPNQALQYAESLLELTTNESTFMDLMGMLDIQGAGSIGLGLAKGAFKSTTTLAKALKDSRKGIDPKTGEVDQVNQIAATGDLGAATQAKVARDIFRRADPLDQATEVFAQTHLLTRPDLIEGINTPLATSIRGKGVIRTLADNAVDIAKSLTKGVWAERVPEELIAKQVALAQERFLAEHPGVHIVDKRIIVNKLGHVRTVEFQIADRDGNLFLTPERADWHAQHVEGFDFQRAVVRNEPTPEVLAAIKTRLSNNVVNKGMGLENARMAAQEGRPQPGPTQFQTSMGSSYTVHPDGTTTRLKKARPEHTKTVWANKDTDIPVEVIHSEKPSAGPDGRMYQAVKYEGKKTFVPADELKTVFDEGLKKPSTKTVYLTQEQANRLAPTQGSTRFVEHNDGTLSLAARNEGGPNKGKWGISPEAKNVPYSTQPEKGLIPLELWRKGDSADKKIISQWLHGNPVYPEHHFGNKIVEVMKSEADDVDALIANLEHGGAQFLPGDRAISRAEKELNDAATMEIRQEGARWYIAVTKPLDDTLPGIRSDLETITTNNSNPLSLGNFLLGGLARSAEDQLAYFTRGARNVVTHVPQELMRVMKDVAKQIGTVRGKEFKELEAVLNNDLNHVSNVNGKAVRGMAHQTQQKLEETWLSVNGTLPTPKQSLAYWSYHQLMAADWVMRNMGVLRDLMRQGVEHYSFEVGEQTVFAPGRFEKTLPWGHKENPGILVNFQGIPQHFWMKDMPDRVKDIIKGKIEGGEWKVIQIANPVDKPFGALERPVKNTVNFVVTDNAKGKPLPMNLVDWNPGVHVIYPHPWFVKQAMMAIGEKGVLRYFGDKTIFGADTEKEAIFWSKGVTKFQEMMRNKATDAELQAFVEKNLPRDLDFWKGQFTPTKTADAFLDLNHPISHTYTGKTVFDTNPKLKPAGLTDERNSEFNLFGAINMDFMANRDGPLQTITRGGTAEKPIYSIERARTLDPFRSLTRGLVTSIDNLVVNDAKYAQVEQWVAQYKHLLPNPEQAAANPFQAFYGYKPDKSLYVDPMVMSAVNVRERIIQFLGTSTDFGKQLNWLQQKMMNSFGEKEARYYNDHELRFLKNPVAFTKAWMFNEKFGFLNPAQFLVQGMGFTHVMAVAGPAAAGRGVTGYVLARALKMTDDIPTINRISKIAENMGWKPGVFKEAYTAMRSYGFDIIGKEHSMSAQTFDPNIFKNGVNTALEWGRIPFTEGERLTRETAWFTAFHEWRLKNPTKEFDNFQAQELILRAGDLSGNMTKASHSRLQEGIFEVPTQFYTFSHRMLEQFWGGRLTPSEKLRAGLTHSALFGLPVTAAIGIPWPINDSLKQTLMEEGSPLLDNGWYKAATEGYLSWMTHMITGTEYNVEQRYGPGFSDYFKKLVNGELKAIEMIGGATGSFLASLGKSLYPFYAHVALGMHGRQEEFPLTKEDIMGVLREISSVNNAHNAVYALNTGKYLSRNESFVQDGLTATDAAMMMLGLTRKDITDTRLMVQSVKHQKDAQQAIAILAEKEIKRAHTYMGDGDWQKAETHLARAKTMMTVVGDFTDDLINKAMQRAISEDTPLAKKIQKEFTEKGNKSQLPGRLQRLYDGKITN